MFLVECRNVPPGTPRGVDFWLLRFLLSVSDVQPDAVPRPKRPSPAPRVLSAPRPPPPSHSATRNRLACRSASVSRENQQQIIFSVLNKLLYFDTRQRGAVVFSGSRSGTWGAHAGERRRTAASWGTGPNAVLRGTSPPPPPVIKASHPKGPCFALCPAPHRLSSGCPFGKVKARELCLAHAGFARSLGSTICSEQSEEAEVPGGRVGGGPGRAGEPRTGL